MKRHAHSYNELQRVASRYYNDTNFCTVLAVAVAAQVSFGKARATMAKAGREHRRGTPFYSQHIFKNSAETLGCTLEEIPATGKTVVTAARNCGAGVYWILVKGHIIAVDDGNIIDWTAARPSKRKVLTMWKLTRNFETIERQAA